MNNNVRQFVQSNISTDKQKEKSFIIEDIVKFAVSRGMKPPNLKQLDNMCDQRTEVLEEILDGLPELWVRFQKQVAFIDSLGKFMKSNEPYGDFEE